MSDFDRWLFGALCVVGLILILVPGCARKERSDWGALSREVGRIEGAP